MSNQIAVVAYPPSVLLQIIEPAEYQQITCLHNVHKSSKHFPSLLASDKMPKLHSLLNLFILKVPLVTSLSLFCRQVVIELIMSQAYMHSYLHYSVVPVVVLLRSRRDRGPSLETA